MGLKRNLKKAKRSKKKASKKASKKTSKKTSKKKKGKKLIGGVNGEVVPNEEAGENGVVPTDPAPAPASGGSKKKVVSKTKPGHPTDEPETMEGGKRRKKASKKVSKKKASKKVSKKKSKKSKKK